MPSQSEPLKIILWEIPTFIIGLYLRFAMVKYICTFHYVMT